MELVLRQEKLWGIILGWALDSFAENVRCNAESNVENEIDKIYDVLVDAFSDAQILTDDASDLDLDEIYAGVYYVVAPVVLELWNVDGKTIRRETQRVLNVLCECICAQIIDGWFENIVDEEEEENA